MPRGRNGSQPSAGSANVHQINISNQTTSHFLGGHKPSWMANTPVSTVPRRRVTDSRTTDPTQPTANTTDGTQANSRTTDANHAEPRIAALDYLDLGVTQNSPVTVTMDRSQEPDPARGILTNGSLPHATHNRASSAAAQAANQPRFSPIDDSQSPMANQSPMASHDTIASPIAPAEHVGQSPGEVEQEALALDLDALIEDLDAQGLAQFQSSVANSPAEGELYQHSPSSTTLPPEDVVRHRPTTEAQPHAKRRRVDTDQTSQGTDSTRHMFVTMLAKQLEKCQNTNDPAIALAEAMYKYLLKASQTADYSYLIIHQLVCLWIVNRTVAQAASTSFLTASAVDDACHNLRSILVEVRDRPPHPNHVVWMSTFPTSLPGAVTFPKAFPKHAAPAFLLLANLGRSWPAMMDAVTRRGFPLLFHEISESLRCPSDILSQRLFLSSLNLLGVGDTHLRQNALSTYAGDRDNEYQGLVQRLPLQVMSQSRARIANQYLGIVHQAASRNMQFVPRQHQLVSDAAQQAQYDYALGHNGRSQQSPPTGLHPSFQAQGGHTMQHGMLTPNGTNQASHTMPMAGQSPPPQAVFNSPGPHNFAPGHARLHGPAHMLPNITGGNVPAGTYGGMPQGQWPSSPQASPRYSPQTHSNLPTTASANPSAMVSPPVLQSQIRPHVRPSSHMAGRYEDPRGVTPPMPTSFGYSQAVGSPTTYNLQFQPQNQLPRNSRDGSRSGHPTPNSTDINHRLDRRSNRQGQLRRITESEYPTDPYDVSSLRPGLHLLRQRSPTRAPETTTNCRFYQFVESWPILPLIVRPRVALFRFQFDLSSEDCERTAKSTGAPGIKTSQFSNGSRRYRLRICSTTVECASAPTVHEWVGIPTYWPRLCFVTFNDTPLHLSRKQHFARDLPLELSDFVRPGENVVWLSLPEGNKTGVNYFLAVEQIVFMAHEGVEDLVRNQSPIPLEAVKDELAKRLSPDATDDLVIGAHSISVADPFTSVLWVTPVRGVACKHLDCFDLDTWLQTRPKKMQLQSEATLVDSWKCPLCSGDARPSSLRIDEYFLQVRRELVEEGLENAKRISVVADGSWTAEAIEDDDGDEDGTPFSRTLARGSNVPDGKERGPPPPEIIEILDDD